MFKNVKYRGKVYKIEYNYSIERRINGFTHHELHILGSQNERIFSTTWVDKYNERKSIIGKVRFLIEEYLNKKYTYDDMMYLAEFEKWDGELDNWDE